MSLKSFPSFCPLPCFLPRNGHRRLGGDEPATAPVGRDHTGELPKARDFYGPVLTPILSSSSSWIMIRGVTIIIRLEASRPMPTFLNNRSR